MYRQQGQALIEAAVLLPLLVGLLLATAQIGLIYHTKQIMYMAAHHGALVAATGGDGVFEARDLLLENGIAPSRIGEITVERDGNLVTLSVECLVPALFNLEPFRQREHTLTARVTMGQQLIPRIPGEN